MAGFGEVTQLEVNQACEERDTALGRELEYCDREGASNQPKTEDTYSWEEASRR